MSDLEPAQKEALYRQSLHRLSELLDCGLTKEQLDCCISLLNSKLCNPEALAQVVKQFKQQTSDSTR